MRNPNSKATLTIGDHPIALGLGTTVLAALVLLFALRHLFGSVSVQGGVK